MYSIYQAINKVNNKSYIGFDSKWPRRRRIHKWLALTKKVNTYFHKAIRKYGWNNFEWKILFQSSNLEETLNIQENFFIEKYNSYNQGYNLTKGGEGTLGHSHIPWNKGKTHTTETRKKISNSKLGKKHSIETIEKMKFSHKGKILDPKTIEKMKRNNSKFWLGKKHTKETKEKISKSNSLGNHYSAIKISINGIIFNTKKEAYQYLNINKYQLDKLINDPQQKDIFLLSPAKKDI